LDLKPNQVPIELREILDVKPFAPERKGEPLLRGFRSELPQLSTKAYNPFSLQHRWFSGLAWRGLRLRHRDGGSVINRRLTLRRYSVRPWCGSTTSNRVNRLELKVSRIRERWVQLESVRLQDAQEVRLGKRASNDQCGLCALPPLSKHTAKTIGRVNDLGALQHRSSHRGFRDFYGGPLRRSSLDEEKSARRSLVVDRHVLHHEH